MGMGIPIPIPMHTSVSSAREHCSMDQVDYGPLRTLFGWIAVLNWPACLLFLVCIIKTDSNQVINDRMSTVTMTKQTCQHRIGLFRHRSRDLNTN